MANFIVVSSADNFHKKIAINADKIFEFVSAGEYTEIYLDDSEMSRMTVYEDFATVLKMVKEKK